MAQYCCCFDCYCYPIVAIGQIFSLQLKKQRRSLSLSLQVLEIPIFSSTPYSIHYNFRQFTLKESFWFALTSFTPQGGGEAPKALSGRTLVAAYWLFVVLMLATFTANLAAFLTGLLQQFVSIFLNS